MRSDANAASPADEMGQGTLAQPSEQLGKGWRWQAVCASGELLEGGDGVRFEVPGATEALQAFAVRADGVVRAYLNRCSHVPVELDWQPGRFFDDSGLYLVCATHGAMYDAVDGRCVGGPCAGRGLAALHACEQGGTVWVAIRNEEA
jgi:nitrite reductase/ring-hydroxylating ferredoxin subunit